MGIGRCNGVLQRVLELVILADRNAKLALVPMKCYQKGLRREHEYVLVCCHALLSKCVLVINWEWCVREENGRSLFATVKASAQ